VSREALSDGACRKGSWADYLGTPFGITVDFASLKNGTITLRDRDSLTQVIGPISDVLQVVYELVNGSLVWSDVTSRLQPYSGVQDVE
jgi:glycyl-tRNA synthetase